MDFGGTVFSDPELARVGLSEAEAQKRGIPHRVATIPMAQVRRTVTLSETRGFLKALISDRDAILAHPTMAEVLTVLFSAVPARSSARTTQSLRAENDEILGFTAFVAEAGEVMSVVQTAMLAKLPYTSLGKPRYRGGCVIGTQTAVRPTLRR